jgi:hypothetical protein
MKTKLKQLAIVLGRISVHLIKRSVAYLHYQLEPLDRGSTLTVLPPAPTVTVTAVTLTPTEQEAIAVAEATAIQMSPTVPVPERPQQDRSLLVEGLLDEAHAQGLKTYPQLMGYVERQTGESCSRRAIARWKKSRGLIQTEAA